jgi:hypothetical protein
MGAFLRIEAGADMRGPAPARRSTLPPWVLRMKTMAHTGRTAAARWVTVWRSPAARR